MFRIRQGQTSVKNGVWYRNGQPAKTHSTTTFRRAPATTILSSYGGNFFLTGIPGTELYAEFPYLVDKYKKKIVMHENRAIDFISDAFYWALRAKGV